MQFIQFKEQMRDLLVFDTSAIRLLDPKFDSNVLSDWQKKGYIKKIIKGFYIFSDLKLDDSVRNQIANKIYWPSYVSMEKALSFYGLIPEIVWAVTSVTTKKTKTFYTDIGNFTYKSIKPNLFFGYELDSSLDVKFKFAKLEKAVLDYFYYYSDLDSESAIEDIRFDYRYFFEIVNWQIFDEYLDKFSNLSLTKRIKILRGMNVRTK